MLGLGKLGSREMSYHSDLDLILIYEGDGRTMPPPGSIALGHFRVDATISISFPELARQIIKAASYMGPRGRLYQVDMRLRPTGKFRQPGLTLERIRALLPGRGRAALGAPSAEPGPGRVRRRRVCRRGDEGH